MARPAASVAAAAGVAARSLSEESSEPHPAASSAREAIRTARSRGTAGKDNGRRVPLSPAVRPYDHVLLDLDGCRLGRRRRTSRCGRGRRRAARSGQVGPLRHQRRAARARGVRAQAVGARLPGLARRGAERRRRACSSSWPSAAAGGSAYVVGSQALVDHVAEAGLRIVNGTHVRRPRRRRGGRRPRRASSFEELKIATQAVLRGARADRRHARRRRSRCPTACGPGPARCWRRSRPPPGARPRTSIGKPEPAMYAAARDRLGAGPRARRRRPAGRRRRGRAPRRASTRRSCSPA